MLRRDQRDFCFPPQACWSPLCPATTPVPLRKNRARHERHLRIAATAAGFRLRLGGGVALRLRCAKRFSPPSAPHSPLADRRPKPDIPHTRARCSIRQSVIGQFQIFQSLIVKLRAIWLVAEHRDEPPFDCVASSVAPRILRVVRLNAHASVPP